MSALPRGETDDARTLREVARHLRKDAPADLVRRLEAMTRRLSAGWITTGEAAALLGVSSKNTVKNWLEGGHFPSATRTAGGHWRFQRAEVEAVRRALDAVKAGPVGVGELELPVIEEGEEVEGIYGER
jgi:excisionase family DNA binding protein